MILIIIIMGPEHKKRAEWRRNQQEWGGGKERVLGVEQD
jgi:hypothetical protein